VPPSVAGKAVDGKRLKAAGASFDGAKPFAYAYAWQRCDAAGASCVDLAVFDDTYVPTAADAGSTFRLAVEARNPVGRVDAVSEPTAVVEDGEVDPLLPHLAAGSAPTFSGANRVGSKLSAQQGSWEGARPVAYAYRWQRCGQSGESCTDIAGATRRTYVLSRDDVGFAIRMVVTATNSHGSGSAATTARYLAPNAPVADPAKAPQVTGTRTVGSLLTATTGRWTGGKVTSYAFQWQRCNAAGTDCTSIPGADQQTYVPTAEEAGAYLRVFVTASNADGSGSAFSALRGPVRS
jgi:hypothetical protein